MLTAEIAAAEKHKRQHGNFASGLDNTDATDEEAQIMEAHNCSEGDQTEQDGELCCKHHLERMSMMLLVAS